MEKRLYRSRSDRMIWGVCGGIARYFNIDPTVIRVIAVILLVLSMGWGILAYLLVAIVVPLESSPAREPRDVMKENVEEIKQTASQLGDEIRSTFTKREEVPAEAARTGQLRRNLLGISLIIIGLLFLLASFKIFWWFRWAYLWPLILIAIGLIIVFVARRR